MKTRLLYLLRLFLLILFIPGSTLLVGQSADFYTVSGMVVNGQDRRPLANVNISIPDSRIGTITNSDGTFSLKIRRDLPAEEIEFSHVGFLRRTLAVTGTDADNLTISLLPRPVVLDEVVVYRRDPMALVEEALRRVDRNYVNKASRLTGFYRETVQKRHQYIDISEAVMEMYSNPYLQGTRGERTRIIKGRRLISPRSSDTLAVKLLGGPNTYIYGDIVKNREFVFGLDRLHYYRFELEPPVAIDERLHEVVRFYPQVILNDEVLFTGKLYIDRETLTISRAEFGLDMSDPAKVSQIILRKKPLGLRFTPAEVSYVASYRQRDGRSYLNYIRNTIRFRCDWRRRVFRTNYTVVAEFVVTDGKEEDVTNIPYRDAFRESHSLSDRVNDFYDEDFWESYNIIEPTESLESAVGRLMKWQEK